MFPTGTLDSNKNSCHSICLLGRKNRLITHHIQVYLGLFGYISVNRRTGVDFDLVMYTTTKSGLAQGVILAVLWNCTKVS